MTDLAVTPPAAGGPARRSVGSFLNDVRHNPWTAFLARRLLGLVLVFVVLVIGVFFLIQLVPGDPIANFLGAEASQDDIDRLRAENGFDNPLLVQLKDYVVNLFQGDMGRSFQSHQSVTEIITDRTMPSVELALLSLAIVLGVSIPLGLIAGSFTREGRHRRVEVGFMTFTGVLAAIPELLIAVLLVYLVAIRGGWLPVGGEGSIEQLILPALALAIPPTMTLTRIVRVETLNVLTTDYVRTARSKWLRPHRIFFRHVLPNVLTAALTIAGLLFAALLGGAVVIEIIFARTGLAATLVNAVLSKEYTIVQGVVLVLGMAVVVINTIIDIILAILDPRSLARSS